MGVNPFDTASLSTYRLPIEAVSVLQRVRGFSRRCRCPRTSPVLSGRAPLCWQPWHLCVRWRRPGT